MGHLDLNDYIKHSEETTIPEEQQKSDFQKAHPFISSLPEAGKQFGTRAVKSYPDFAKGANDALALAGALTGNENLTDFGKQNAEFWQEQSDKIQIDPNYQGLKGLSSKETFIPTLAGEIGGQATNIITALGGGGIGAKVAGKLGVQGLAKAGLVGAGATIPNLAQEGQYLEKIEQFEAINGRKPNNKELKQIQNVAFAEKAVNTVLETVADKLLFGKLFPQGTVNKGIGNILKNTGEQAVTEGLTETAQEGVSIGAEKILGINQGNNAKRLLESGFVGGLVGGAIGVGSTLISQPYNSQFEQQETLQKAKEIFDKAVNKSKEFTNKSDSFDNLKELSKDGTLNNKKRETKISKVPEELKEIAPKTYARQKAIEDKNIIDLERGKDYFVEENTEQKQLSGQEQKLLTSKKEEKKVEYPLSVNVQKTPNFVLSASKTEIKNDLKELAPNTYARQQNSSYKKGDFIQGDEGIYEVMDSGVLRNVDDDTTTQFNPKSNYEKYTPNEYNFIEVENFKYNPKEHSRRNAENYVNSQEDYVNAYNEYVKNPTLENKEKYQYIYGEKLEKYNKLEPMFKDVGANLPAFKNETKDEYTYEKKHSKYDGDVINLYNKKGDNLGYASYSIDNDVLSIDYVSSNKIEKGVSEKLVSKLIEENPNKKINWDCVTKDSEYARKSFVKKHPEYTDKIQGLWYDEVKAQFDKDEDVALVTNNSYNTKKGSANGQKNNNHQFNEAIFQGTRQDLSNDLRKGSSNNEKSSEYGGSRIESSSSSSVDERRETTSNSVRGKSRTQNVSSRTKSELEKIAPNTAKRQQLKAEIENTNLYYDNTQTFGEITGEKTTEKGNNIKEVSDNGIDGSTNQTRNNRSSNELSERLSENETMVQEQSELANRSNKESVGRNRATRTSDNESVRNERLTDEHKALIEKSYKNQHELNQAIENFISNNEYEKYDVLPDEVKSWFKKYTGAGGFEKQGAEGKGLLSEYYTPENIVKKMWEMTAQYIDTNGTKVLEPSVGIGRFLEYAPENTNFDVVEMNPTSAKITELLYPNANVTVGEFQEKFINKETNSPVKKVSPEYDIVIGNPPYGQYSGRYKGLGEGKGIARIEHYFIKRGLDTLKENGVMTFIVPSSFLDSSITKAKQEIGVNAELIDAYRLPENTFSTTSIGTDIIVLRKKKNSGNVSLLNAGNWFKQHPDKILGSVETRKNRFGKEETFIKGDKNAVDNINTSKKDIKQTVEVQKTEDKNQILRKNNEKNSVNTKKSQKTQIKGNIEYTRYEHENPVSKEELKYFADTRVDGTLPKDKYSPNEKVNMFNGDLYNDFNYLQGDIYEKLDALETENISEKQKEIQRKKLMSVLPERKGLEQINLTPTSDFIREYPISDTYYDKWQAKEITETTYLDRKYLKYVENLTRSERNGVNVYDIDSYVKGGKISIRYRGNPTKEEKENQRAEYLTKLKNTVDKTFNDFLNSELSIEEVEKLTEKWNRTFNNLYTPDYKKMPMIVQDLNSKFKGKDLKLQDVQVEGINFLTNKGVGLLGFEVGVGKTLSGIISTVQNMQMGRCKRPLIIVPKQVKPNWIREINEAFPNIKVNDLDNLGKFNGEIQDGTVSIATFQALDNLWYSQDTINKLLMNTYEVGNDFNRDSTKRGREQAKERNEEFVGKAEKDNKKKHTFEELGFDHITVDEAHNFKNLFASAKADGKDGNTYSKITGAESTRAKRMFLATQYILSNNNNRNVFMLTATPFNNSPLEVFNMLSYIAKDKLDNMGLYNVYQFMENYVGITADWVVDSKNNVVYKQIPKAFKNLQSLQAVIDTCMLIRSAEDAGIERPNKHTVKVILEPTQEQLDLIAKAEAEAVQVPSEGKRDGGAVLRAISKARTATLSPAIYNNDFDISVEDFVKGSPKLEYVLSAIESMKQKDHTTGQLLYMPLGVDFLPKIKEYLVNKKVFKADEIAIIKSGVNDEKITEITDSFNDKDGKIKLIIGTNKMREGMNLNGHTSVLYVPYMDWNPTDYLQIVGRIWRRGNDYKNIRVVVPLLKDSSDPFMFQKLDEKTSRINNIMDRGKDYIDTAELDTAEEKINMITNPDKKATMFSQIEEQKLRNEKNKLEGQLETTKHYKNELASLESDIKGYETTIEKYEKRLDKIEDKESWEYSSVQSYIEKYKKDLARTKQTLKYTKVRIERLELDFNGKDSEEAIQEKIKDVEKQVENLKEITEIKKAQYKDEYEKNRKSGKSIIEHIKEFEKQTDELYGGESFYYEANPILKGIVNKLSEIAYKNKTIKLNNFVKDKDVSYICRNINFSELPSDITISFVNEKGMSKYGATLNATNHIYINIAKIGDDIPLLFETLGHEIKHIEQSVKFRKINSKPRNKRTLKEIKFCNEYKKGQEVNRKLALVSNEETNKIIKFIRENSPKTGLSSDNFAKKYLTEKNYNLYQNYKTAYNEYYDSEYEREAREQGTITRGNADEFEREQKRNGGYSRFDFAGRLFAQPILSTGKSNVRRIARRIVGKGISFEESLENNSITKNDIILRDVNIDVDEILPKVKKPKDSVLERIFTPISTRLDKIDPTLKHAIRKFELDTALTENKYASIITPFIEKLSKMSEADYAKYDLALKNGRKETIINLNIKYGLMREYKNIRKLLDDIRNEAVKYGLDVGYIEDYFPRKVINPSAILEEYSKSSYIRKLLKEVDPNNTLSDDEKLEKINIALKGHNGAINANSSFVKNRKITEITKDLNRYYKDSKMALVDYITSMNNAIQTRKFFGKGDKLDESIGAYTRDLLEQGIISPNEEVKLKQILKARFNQKGIEGFVQDAKNIGYIFSMGNPFSAITQIGDFAFTLYRNGIFNTMVGLKKSLSGNKISREDLGISKIAQEFESDSKTSKLVDKVFKLVGLEHIDSLGKETFINGALNRLQNEAKEAIANPKTSKTAKFYNNLRTIFGDESYEVLQDLSKGNVTDNVKYLLFSEISDFQPISLAEMPEVYLTSGNGRIFYMLKTYSIKLIDVYRNEVFRQFKTNPKLGLQNLIRLTFFVSLLGVGADGLKDLLMGREFDFEATFLDNILKLAMFSEYKLGESKKEGIGKSALALMLPPTNVLDDLYKDVLDEKLYSGEKPISKMRTFRNVPAIGKLYYWWFGGGLDVKEKEFKQNRKKDYIKSFKNKDKDLFKSTTKKILDKGYSPKETKKFIKNSRNEYLKPYKQDMKLAFAHKDKDGVKKAMQKMKNDGIPESERKKIYKQVIDNYMKTIKEEK